MSKIKNKTIIPRDINYISWLADLKKRIKGSRQKALLAANEEQIKLYHYLGCEILERQSRHGWGSKIIDRLSSDLKEAFPDMRGLSGRNLKYMSFFAKMCPDITIGQQSAAQLPWFHIITIITSGYSKQEQEFYAREAVDQSWSRDTLAAQIKNQLHLRKGAAFTNFTSSLKTEQANLAQEMLKDPYHFDFLGLGEEAKERDIENALVRHIKRFLLELGKGFAFVGQQYRLEVGGDEFFLDLLFYHIKLKCYVVVELKATDFKPEHAGQLNFYLTAVDKLLKGPDDKPTIGLLLCKTKKQLVAEYAFSGIEKPMGVAEYQLIRSLPEPLDTCLPTIEELEFKLSAEV